MRPPPSAALIIAPMLATGSATPNVPVLASGAVSPRAAFGAGSIAADMVRLYRANDLYRELWVLPVLDPVAATAATSTVTVDTVATSAGVLYVAVADRTYPVLVTNSMAVADVATAVAAAVNADSTALVTAAAAAAVVTLTTKHKGLLVNDIEVGIAPLGAAGGQPVPPGLT